MVDFVDWFEYLEDRTGGESERKRKTNRLRGGHSDCIKDKSNY